MDKEEAKEILDGIVAEYRKKSYAELVELANGDIGAFDVGGKSGTIYEVEIDIFRDEKNEENIRFDTVIDCGVISSYFPMKECFVKNPNNEFVAEGYEDPLF
ncbi:MAG: hypothetical protein ACR2N3_11260 [Pyrinomonadaceae bacterium]